MIVRETAALLEGIASELGGHSEGENGIDPYLALKRFALNTSVALNYAIRFDRVDSPEFLEIIEVEEEIER
jgi:hypothetical protein